MSWHRRQWICVSEAVSANTGFAVAGTRAFLRHARHCSNTGQCLALWANAVLLVDRRPWFRNLSLGLPTRRSAVPDIGCFLCFDARTGGLIPRPRARFGIGNISTYAANHNFSQAASSPMPDPAAQEPDMISVRNLSSCSAAILVVAALFAFAPGLAAAQMRENSPEDYRLRHRQDRSLRNVRRFSLSSSRASKD